MYCVSFFGEILKAYGNRLEHLKSLGYYITDNYILAIKYSKAVKENNK